MSRHRTRKPRRIAHERGPARPAPSPSAVGARVLAPAAPARRTPRQERARELVDALVEAAAQLLVERGYEGASTNAIAERAGVSVGSLYQYFSGKSDVFRELMERHRAEVHPLVAHALRGLEGDGAPAPIVESLLDDLLRLHGRRPELMRAMDTQLGHVANAAGNAQEEHAAIALARIFERRGAGTHDECRAFAWLLATVVSTVSRRLVHSPPADVDARAVVRGVGRMVNALFGDPR